MFDLSCRFIESSFINDKGEEIVYYRLRVFVEDGSPKPYFMDLRPSRDQIMVLKSNARIDRV